MRHSLVVVGAACCVLACSQPAKKDETPTPREGQPDIVWCPGSPGCEATGAGTLMAGAAKRDITPRGFEIANVHYLRGSECDPITDVRFGVHRCGELLDDQIRDCGKDGLCPGDTGYTAPDADGSEDNGTPDYFLDCGLDRICPGNAPELDDPGTPNIDEAHDGVDNDGDGAIDDGPYAGPDADGTEGDGVFQAGWLAGFGNNRPMMGVHDPVEVRCMAFRSNSTTVVHCMVDAIGFFYDELVRARVKLKERHPETDVDYFSMASTHTHESVDLMGQWGRADPVPVQPGRLGGHNAYIVDQMVDAAAEAVAQLKPARIIAAQVQTGGDILRDGTDPQIMDDTLTVFEAQDATTNAPIFTALHWGNHPEAMGDDNSLLTADYVHYVRNALENGLPATGMYPAHAGRGGMAIYVQGTVGGIMSTDLDIVARDGTAVSRRPRTFARLQAYSERLAEYGLAALENTAALTTVTSAEIKVKARTLSVPVKNRAFIFSFSSGLFDRAIYDDTTGQLVDPAVTDLFSVPLAAKTEVFSLEIGPLSFLSVPGELFPEIAIGGYDGSRSFGRPFIAADFCPSQDSCTSHEAGGCPVERPADGYMDCGCEACRLCVVPPTQNAPPGPYLKERMPGQLKMVLGLANDEIGYLVPPYYFRVSEFDAYLCEALNHYEETNSAGPDAVPRLEEALGKLLQFAL